MKESSMYVMAVLYLAAGIYHFVNPRFYLKIVPSVLPFHEAIVAVSGVLEILFAILLLFDPTRHIAAWLIILLLIAIYPANIYMAMKWYRKQHPKLWIAIVRLPLQFVLIWWAYVYTK